MGPSLFPEPCPQRTSAQESAPLLCLFKEEATWAQRSLMAVMGQGSKDTSETGGRRVLSEVSSHCPEAA